MTTSLFSYIRQRLNFSLTRKVPQILQTESAECGLACLAMICRYFGMDTDLFNLRQRFGISSHGATLALLTNLAGKLHLKARPLTLDIDEIRQLKTPCILHWDMCHFVVLTSARSQRFVIHDPACGRRVIGLKELSRYFTGVALELWPEGGFAQSALTVSKLKLRDLMKNIDGLMNFIGRIFFYSLLIEAITLLLPVGTQLVMDHVIIARDHSLLSLICLGLLSFILCRTFVSSLRAWSSLVLSSLIDVQWKTGIFDHLMRLPLAYFEKRKLGDIQSRIGSLNVIRKTLTDSLIHAIIDIIVMSGVLIGMFLYGGWLVWVVCAFTLIYLGLRFFTYSLYRQASEEQIVKEARSSSHFMETLYAVGTLKALGISALRSRFWLNLNIDATNATIRMTKLEMVFGGLANFINATEQIAMLWLGSTMVIEGNMTLGMFVAFSAYRSQFSERTTNLINVILQLRMLSLHNERIADILLTAPEKNQPETPLSPPDCAADFKVNNLAYQHDKLSPPLFHNLTLHIQPGESVAITGPSGVGKTTLMKVMSGLLSPSEGQVLFNNQEICSAGLNNYRRSIACVLQEDKLFAGSIAENICSFEENRDYQRILDCAQRCNLHAEIMRMPMGYETLTGELGGNLSGGQKQRLLIARALYRQPGLIFMDEATSHLDLENEEIINQAIRQLNITRIFIAHRPSTIASADRIIDLSGTGQV